MSDSRTNQPSRDDLFWLSPAHLEGSAEYVAQHHDEFPQGTIAQDAPLPRFAADEEGSEAGGVSRRQFFGIVTASAAAVATTSLTGCIRKEQQHIYPYTERPEHLLPGEPIYFRTATQIGGAVYGLHVESQEMRPTKVEGNPDHPMNNPLRSTGRVDEDDVHRHGGVHPWIQASVLSLYDIDRSREPKSPKANPASVNRARLLSAPIGADGKPDATRAPKTAGAWALLAAQLDALLTGHEASGGADLALLLEAAPSPTIERLLNAARARFPRIQLFRHDPAFAEQSARAVEALTKTGARLVYNLDRAQRVVAVDCNFLGDEGDVVRNARLFADGRRLEEGRMNRLYAVGPILNVTSATADEHLRLPASQAGGFLAAVAKKIAVARPGAFLAPAKAFINGLPTPTKKNVGDALVKKVAAWVEAVSADLLSNAGASVVLVGERQPLWVHLVGHAINQALGNLGPGKPVEAIDHGAVPAMGDIAALGSKLGGEIKTLIALGTNPVLTAPADVGIAKKLGKINFIHLSAQLDETASIARYHLPRSHYLEAWCDWRASDGTISLQQPLILPLHASVADVELLAVVAYSSSSSKGQLALRRLANPEQRNSGYEQVRGTWGRVDEGVWKETLFKGLFFEGTVASLAGGRPRATRGAGTLVYDWTGATITGLMSTPPTLPKAPTSDRLELNLMIDPSVCDGRFANNPWLQELPDPISKLTWDNAAYVSHRTATELDIMSRPYGQLHKGEVVTIAVGKAELTIPVMVIPGMADNVIAIGLGYGRAQKLAGKIAQPDPEDPEEGGGANGYYFHTTRTPWTLQGATITKLDARRTLATTQEHWNIDAGFRRPIVQELRIEEATNAKAMKHNLEHGELGALKNEKYGSVLFDQSNFREGADKPYRGRFVPQWGMVIDLNTCTGCNACVIACQAENNIPVVGKERVLNGREMHWIRIDRYFRGASADDPATIMFQPMACGHCETAPCETVCPVAATMHSPEGTNDMVYNRCIGTRYCSNNCPYKVRRYNFFNYQKENNDQNPLGRMQKNPDVSIRFRGVMEKCTYCIQRIMRAKGDHKREGTENFMPDGAVITACQQACPSRAIVFGDVGYTRPRREDGRDNASLVARLKKNDRNYAVLAELNIHPRTTYLARVRNPHPTLTPLPKPEGDGHGGKKEHAEGGGSHGQSGG